MPQFIISEIPAAPPRKGSVLVVMLVALLLLSALLLQMQVTARSRLSLHLVAMEEMRLRAAMTDAVYQALQRLADDPDLLVDHSREAWAEGREIKDPTGISIRVDIQDAAARFDLNNLHLQVPDLTIRPAREVAGDLFMQCGDFSAADRVDSLIDWVDPDNEGFREADYYREKKAGYEPANRHLQSWAELLLVNGLSRDYVHEHRQKSAVKEMDRDLLDTFTIIPVNRTRPIPVNVNTAPRHVLLGVLGLDHSAIVDSLVTLRASQPVRKLSLLEPLIDPTTMTTVQTYLDVKSAYYIVQARAYLEGLTADLRALVHRRGDGTIEVMQWAM